MNDALIDTTELQFGELYKFASALGFHYSGRNFQRTPRNALLKCVTTISFSTMVAIFSVKNKYCWSHVGKYAFYNIKDKNTISPSLIPFYAEDVEAAFESQSIDRVKLQSTKKGIIQALSQKVYFVNQDAQIAFMNENGLNEEHEYDAILTDWAIDDSNGNIHGEIQLDRKGRFLDGERVITSRLSSEELERAREGVVVSTRNTKYLLGNPSAAE